jgi:hypothetical protein
LNAIVPQNFGAVSTKFANVPREDDLSAGIQAGFGIIGYKGKVWSIRYRGQETPLMRPDGDGPRNSIEVVILRASGHVSKIWYENGYTEGSNAAPDCFSTNGVTPDGGSKKRQSNSCATCPMNQWGARITPQGKQGKACSDSKRLAVVPLGDLKNELYGGPLLLRVPAASLRDLAGFDDKMKALGYPYYSIGARISFDSNEAYPKFVFGAIRPLTDAEADVVLEARDSRQVTTILAEGSENSAPAPVQQQIASAFEQPPVQPVAAPVVTPQVTPAPVQAPKPVAPAPAAGGFGGAETTAAAPVPPPAPTPAPQPVATTAAPTMNADFEAQLDAALDGLLAD